MPWLTVVIFLPLIGVPVLALWARATDVEARVVAMVVALATFLVSLGMLGAFDPSLPGFQLVEHADWVPSAGLSYLVGVDGFSVWLVVLTAFMIPLAIVASWGVDHRVRLLMAMTLLLETAIMGSFLSLGLLPVFFFFQARRGPGFPGVRGCG